AGMGGVGRPGEIRANLAQGATGSPLPLDHPAGRRGAAALRACGLDFGGVDMVEDSGGAVRVLEVDAWAGFAGITEVTGADVAGAILGHATARRAAGGGGGQAVPGRAGGSGAAGAGGAPVCPSPPPRTPPPPSPPAGAPGPGASASRPGRWTCPRCGWASGRWASWR